jgi:hypothetical protein
LGTAKANESITLTAKIAETVRRVNFNDGQQVEAGDVVVELTSASRRAACRHAGHRARCAAPVRSPTGSGKAGHGVEAHVRHLYCDTRFRAGKVARSARSSPTASSPHRLPACSVCAKVSPGTLVQPGTAITTLDDIHVIKLDFAVAETELAALKPGLARDGALAGVSAAGVRRPRGVARFACRSGHARAHGARADRQPRRPAQAGMLLNVALRTRERERSTVPELALVPIGSKQFVYRIGADATVQRVEVQLGARRAGVAEITGGLAAGERVVVEGTVNLRDGARVTVAGDGRRGGIRAREALTCCCSDLSVKRPVFATVISLLLTVLGLVAFGNLPLRELPDIDTPIVSVNTTYRGADSAVVESRVTKPLEDAVSGIEGIRSIASQSQTGQSSISIEFSLSATIEGAANDVRDAVSRVVGRLPQEADPPQIFKVDTSGDVIIWFNLASSGMNQRELTDYAQRYVVDRLSAVDGVANIVIGGEQRYAMRIAADRTALAARPRRGRHRGALTRENVELPAGALNSTTRDFTVRVLRGYAKPRSSRSSW